MEGSAMAPIIAALLAAAASAGTADTGSTAMMDAQAVSSSTLRPAIPANYPGTWATTNDYPVRALHNMEQGQTEFALTVDTHGRVRSCLVTQSSGSLDLDEATCKLVSDRARFQPATDMRGRPTDGAYSSHVHWVLPSARSALQPGALKFAFTVEPDGSKSGCQVGVTEGGTLANQPVGDVPCEKIPFNGRYTDASGNGVRKRVTITQIVEVEPVAQ
jgi:protein TonB